MVLRAVLYLPVYMHSLSFIFLPEGRQYLHQALMDFGEVVVVNLRSNFMVHR